jgi:hypothetical protein
LLWFCSLFRIAALTCSARRIIIGMTFHILVLLLVLLIREDSSITGHQDVGLRNRSRWKVWPFIIWKVFIIEVFGMLI